MFFGACRGQIPAQPRDGLCTTQAGELRGAPPRGFGFGVSRPLDRQEAGGEAAVPSGVVDRARASVVSIVAGHPAERHGAVTVKGTPAREHDLGSGFILRADGLVMTSRHVINGSDDVRVELDDGRSFPAAVIARDALLDIALLKLSGARDLPVATLGESGKVRVGDPVIAMGNPFGLGPSVRRGILSARAREVDEGPPGQFLQTDAAVNPGDSGGPLLDAEGRVIGIDTAIVEHGQGLSFAIPIDDVRVVLDELESTGRVSRGRVGVTYQQVDPALARALSLSAPEGALVTDVDTGGPAERGGLRPGDLITSIDTRSVKTPGDLSHDLERRKPGDAVLLGVNRAGTHRAFGVLLDRLPNKDGDGEAHPASARIHAGADGLRLVDADGGVRVEALDPATRAADGLRPGDLVVEVNHHAVRRAVEAEKQISSTPRPGAALLRVRREGEFLYVGLDLS
jgi:serine protease Do